MSIYIVSFVEPVGQRLFPQVPTTCLNLASTITFPALSHAVITPARPKTRTYKGNSTPLHRRAELTRRISRSPPAGLVSTAIPGAVFNCKSRTPRNPRADAPSPLSPHRLFLSLGLCALTRHQTSVPLHEPSMLQHGQNVSRFLRGYLTGAVNEVWGGSDVMVTGQRNRTQT